MSLNMELRLTAKSTQMHVLANGERLRWHRAGLVGEIVFSFLVVLG